MSRILPALLVAWLVSPAGLVAQGGEEAAGGGGGLFDINVGLSAWTLVVFGGLVLILSKFGWGRILSAVEAREQGIQSTIDEAARRNEEAAKLLEEHRRQLAEARHQAGELIAEGKVAGERMRKEIEEKARSEGQAMVDRARHEIGRERDAALDALRKESVDLALAAAARLLGENLDQNKDRKLVERYVGELTKERGAKA
jgi:F-type H+-transporting ATPase subunit b